MAFARLPELFAGCDRRDPKLCARRIQASVPAGIQTSVLAASSIGVRPSSIWGLNRRPAREAKI